MADEDDNHASHEGDAYVSERARRYQRFIELGGDTTIDADLRALGQRPTVRDYVTPRHKDLVMDLVASGASHDAIARLFDIPKVTLQALFAYELEAGFVVKAAGLSRALYTSGMSGDTTAALGWLKSNPLSKWASKQELTDKGAEQQDANVEAQAKVNQEWIQGLISGMMTDPKLKRPPKKVDGPEIIGSDTKEVRRRAKPQPRTIRKPKGD